ncbi:MAG: class I SAM-dependent rRNA methyltransferase [Prevotellaceae bacterium]|nr:class I SAM-dependent rRNA methyltransferase [Prevotellaceae bacterium]
MAVRTLRLKRGKEASLRRFHPWVFSGAVADAEGGLDDGDVVRVLSSEGEFLGVGHWQRGSIAVRLLSFDEEGIDADFWSGRLKRAYAMRLSLGLAEAGTLFRLVHGEGDGLPGLVIDIYNDMAVCQAHSVGMHRSRREIATALTAVLGERLSSIYYKSEGTLGVEDEFLCGGGETEVTATENGLRFVIDVRRGQKTGFFIDQRDNRALLERYAKGRRCLNLFSYTGGFSVYALRGGAAEVCSVDSSARAMDLARRNVELNTGDAGQRHVPMVSDAFDFLDETETGRYDLMVLDPPAFAKHLSGVRRALHGYTKLNAKALSKIASGGILFTFSCSQAVAKEQFREAVFTAAALARRRVRILHQLHQAADHPVNIYHPEGEYLKGLVLYVE